ncbi:MAG TPA: hypothetical protein VF384_01540 [Planctomycetota bacterium]
MTPALRAMRASPQVGHPFVGVLDAPAGTAYAVFSALQSDYVPVTGLGLWHLGSPDTLLASGLIGTAQIAAFSLTVPSQSALTGAGLFFQAITNGHSTSLQLTDLLHGRVR